MAILQDNRDKLIPESLQRWCWQPEL